MCETLHIDPVIYMTETDPDKNAIRDAAANRIWERERNAEMERAKNRK